MRIKLIDRLNIEGCQRRNCLIRTTPQIIRWLKNIICKLIGSNNFCWRAFR